MFICAMQRLTEFSQEPVCSPLYNWKTQQIQHSSEGIFHFSKPQLKSWLRLDYVSRSTVLWFALWFRSIKGLGFKLSNDTHFYDSPRGSWLTCLYQCNMQHMCELIHPQIEYLGSKKPFIDCDLNQPSFASMFQGSRIVSAQ